MLCVAAFVGVAMVMSVLREPQALGGIADADFARTLERVGPDPVTGQARVVTPDNHLLTPAGKQISLPGMRPQALALSPDGQILMAAGKIPGLVVLDPSTGEVRARVELPGVAEDAPEPVSGNILKPDKSGQVSFTGLIFSADGAHLYLSNVNGSIKEFTVSKAGVVEPLRNLPLPPANAPGRKNEIPAGLALSADGRKLYVALNLSNQLGEMDLESGVMSRTWAVGVAPYDVRRIGGKLYVSNWGGRRPDGSGPESHAGRGTTVRVAAETGAAREGSLSIIELGKEAVPVELVTGRHASGLAVSPGERWLCVACANEDAVAVLDVAAGRFVANIFPKQTPADLFGAAPNALAFSADGNHLYCCNGTQNAVAVLKWEEGRAEFAGLLPTGWYPGAVVYDGARQQLCVGNVKGITPTLGKAPGGGAAGFNTHQFFGTVSLIPLATDLTASTAAVTVNNRVPLLAQALAPARPLVLPRPVPERVGEPSVFRHVVYIIKENRTYDQVLGDLPQGNGDEKLCIFGEQITPNQHQWCRDFALLDNTYCSGILSADGHNWSCSAITTDYVEKQFAGFPRSYPDGTDLGDTDGLAWSPAGFIWDHAAAKGLGVRIYGEFAAGRRAWKEPEREGKPLFPEIWSDWLAHHGGPGSELSLGSLGNIPSVMAHSCTDYPGFDMDIPDQFRSHAFLAELSQWEATGKMPSLCVMSLGGDHTSGTKPGKPTPRAQVADNDSALAQIVEGLSHSPFWKDTCVIAIEDDPQNGWDHVSGYRTTCYVLSAWSRGRGTISTQYNQTSVLRTIELMLGLRPMNELDATATPLSECFGPEPDFTPVVALPPRWPLDELNLIPAKITDARLRHDAEVSDTLPFQEMDACPEDVLNEILWRSVQGPMVPYPTWAMAAED